MIDIGSNGRFFVILLVSISINLIFSTCTKAQYFNKIVTELVTFDFSNEPPLFLKRINYSNPVNILCNKKGIEKTHYLLGNIITNGNDTLHFNTLFDRTIYINESFPGISLNHCCAILPFINQGDKYHYFIINNNQSTYDKFVFHCMVEQKNDSIFLIEKDSFQFKHQIIALAGGYYEKDSCYWVIAEDSRMSFTAYRIKNNIIDKIVKTDNSLLKVNFGMANDSAFFNGFGGYGKSQLFLSNTDRFLSNAFYFSVNKMPNPELYSGSFLFNFNPETGEISFYDTLAYHSKINGKETNTSIGVWGIPGIVFSPNDNFLYFSRYSNQEQNLIQYDIFKNEYDTLFEFISFAYPDLFLANNGKIYIPDRKGKVYVINDPDLKSSKCNVSELSVLAGNVMSFSFFENLRTDIIFQNTCDYQPNFSVKCDTNRFKNFSWHWGNDSLVGQSVLFQFPKTGRYIVTLKAKTDYGYIRHHTDTFLYIKRPVANFATDTTIGCQWLKFQFRDASVKDTVNAAIGESWLWNFGDGTTDTAQNPAHIYTKSGKYTVKLIYSNGFCYDTIEKQQAVEIIEAPRPGFKMSQTNYCSPYLLQITDTSLGKVKNWHYSFGEGGFDTLASPNYLYSNAGNYKILQTLTGPTGCVTKDSAILHLRKGFSGTEEINSLTTQVIDNKSILVNWLGNEDAFSYNLFYSRNDTNYLKINNQTDTFYNHLSVNPSNQIYFYKVNALDSCSRTTANSRKLRNIILTGETFGNDYSILYWTPFELWQNGVKEYVLEYLDSSEKFATILSSNTREYTDLRFFTETTSFEKCYRIRAIENNGNQQESTSNTLCLEYEAILWIPTAFTPNSDCLNDFFNVKGIRIQNYKIQIFNRWGEIIYESNDPYSGWDGTFNNNPVQTGVYIYNISAVGDQGKRISANGTVMLIR